MQYSDGVDDGDLYGLLGVLQSAFGDDLVRARRLQAKKWHPDHNRDPQAQARMAAVNNALRVLSDAAQRQAYDERLRSLRRVGPAATPTRSPAGVVTLASYLQDRGFLVVDTRVRGGSLWVVAAPGLEPIIDVLRGHGFEFEYVASGGMATDHRPAWRTRTWG
ncbi:MAG: J domain-containing protein [Candidatus Dormiibacterota bacterium]|jgi:curved DNA-binding protein CbpA